MDPQREESGTRDATYDLISVLYHALEGADTCARYAEDARSAGDEKLEAFFQEVITSQSQLAGRAKALLGQRLSGEEQEEEAGERSATHEEHALSEDEKVDESSWESFPASDAPPY